MSVKISNLSDRCLTVLSSLPLIVLICCGCGSSEFPVAPAKGTIKTADGQSLPSGILTFTPTASNAEGLTGKPAYGNIKDGEFVMSIQGRDGAIVGSHKVTLTEAWRPDDQDRKGRKPLPEKHRCELSPEFKTLEVVAGKTNEYELIAVPKKRDRRAEKKRTIKRGQF